MAAFDRGVRPIGDWSMRMTLSICSTPSIDLWGNGSVLARWSCLGERGIQGVIDERAFARAGYASDAYKDAQWDIDIDVLQVVSAGTLD